MLAQKIILQLNDKTSDNIDDDNNNMMKWWFELNYVNREIKKINRLPLSWLAPGNVRQNSKYFLVLWAISLLMISSILFLYISFILDCKFR